MSERETFSSLSWKEIWIQNKPYLEKSQAREADLKKSYREALLPTPTNRIGSVRRLKEGLARKTTDENATRDLLQQTTAKEGESHLILQISKGTLRDLSSKWEKALIIRVFEEVINSQMLKK